MGTRKFAVGLLLMAALGVSLGAAPVYGKAPLLPNTLQLVILHWYPAGQAANFPVGNIPVGLAFDGANIWVSNLGSDTVTRLRASDGTNLGTFAVGGKPWGLAFDGANIWVANLNSNTVTKLQASDGTNLGTFAVGTYPEGMAFDGANIWVANKLSNTVSKH
jgi:DNA-binding beta-propeller fold protein YncE